MYRLFFNLILTFAFSSALIAQETKPANTNPVPTPAPSSATAAKPQTSSTSAAGANQGAPAKPVAPGAAQTKEKDDEDEAQGAKPSATPAPQLAPTAPVITLDFCQGKATKTKATAVKTAGAAAGCKEVITKAQFDKVLDAAIPRNRRPAGGEVPQQVRQAIAKEYLNMYLMAREAEKRGLPGKDPATQEMLKLMRMQVLAGALNQQLQENTKPTDTEVEQYYKDNPSAFVEVSLRRLYIPKPPQTPPAPATNPANSGANTSPTNATASNTSTPATAPKPDPEAQKAALEAQKAAAEKFRERAMAGEDLDKLEKEAFEAVASKQTPPQTQMGNRRRGIMPPDQDAEIFSLNPGQVSKLFDNPGGWYVFKVESRRTVPFNEAKEEIQRKLQPEKLKDAREAITATVKTDLNDKYFGSPAPAPGAAVGKTQRPAPSRPAAPGTATTVPKAGSTADAKPQAAPKPGDSNH